MEVHHSHHHEIPGKEIKPWKHYAIEFFMLFLAVTAGFFTENLRDRFVENERAQEIAVGLYDDLKKDSLLIYNSMKRKDLFIKQMEELMKTLSSPDVKSNVSLLTYYQASFLMEIDMPVPYSANIEQLKNSGSLRYFKDKNLVSEISQWDYNVSVLFKERTETDQKRLIEEIKAVNKVFYPSILDSMRNYSFRDFFENKVEAKENTERLKSTPVELLSYNEQDINAVVGWASERKKNAVTRANSFLPQQLLGIRTLMFYLNKEFDITKEKSVE